MNKRIKKGWAVLLAACLVLGAAKTAGGAPADLAGFSPSKPGGIPGAPRLPGHIQPATWVGQGSQVPNPWGDTNLQIYNQYLDVATSTSGQLTVGTVLGDPAVSSEAHQQLLYGHPYPGSSYTTVRVNGVNYPYGSSGQQLVAPHFDGAQNALVSAWAYGGVRVQQQLSLVGGPTGVADLAFIHYTLTNNGNQPASVGLRVMLDLKMNGHDGVPVIVGGNTITRETDFTGSNVPATFQATDVVNNPQVRAMGVVATAGERMPDRLVFAGWPTLYSNRWDVTVNPNASLLSDDAVATYWNPVTLNPGQSIDVGTRFGVGHACTSNTPTLTWQSPLSASSTTNLSVNDTLHIAFTWRGCSGPVHDESVIIQVQNPQTPDYPVMAAVYGNYITIDDSTGTYRDDFSPAQYGLTPGTDLQVQVFMQSALVGQANLHLTP